MKKVIYIILGALSLSACEKEFNIEKQMKDGMTYMKFVPSNNDDTTFFFVQATTALKNGMTPAKTAGETVSVTVNGTPITLTKDARKSKDMGSQIYWTKHIFKAGDEIVAEASLSGRKVASAATSIPGQGPDFKWTVRTEGKSESDGKQFCFDIEYVNKPGFTGRYGVAVRCEETRVYQCFRVYRNNPDVIEWDEPEKTVIVRDENPVTAFDMTITSLGQDPLVLSPSTLNRDYRWSQRYDEYGNVISGPMGMYNYVFSWVDVPDKEPQTGHQQVRVHYRGGSFDTGAEVPEGYWDWSWAGDVFNGVTSHYEYRYSLMFYNYDENCFNYLKARDNKENELALFGLAPASFTFTNVQDGVGVCGSYMVSSTDWFTIGD